MEALIVAAVDTLLEQSEEALADKDNLIVKCLVKGIDSFSKNTYGFHNFISTLLSTYWPSIISPSISLEIFTGVAL